MRLILSKDGVKREIEAPFALCISKDDLDLFIDSLRSARGLLFTASPKWVQIDPSHPGGTPNTMPQKWTDTRQSPPVVEVDDGS